MKKRIQCWVEIESKLVDDREVVSNITMPSIQSCQSSLNMSLLTEAVYEKYSYQAIIKGGDEREEGIYFLYNPYSGNSWKCSASIVNGKYLLTEI